MVEKEQTGRNVVYVGESEMVEGSADEMEEIEKKLLKQQLCWNANNMDVSSNGMERKDKSQRPEWSVVERHKKRDHDSESSGAFRNAA